MNIVDKILVDPITRGLKFFTKGGVSAYITQVRGRTDGSAVPAGYVGEVISSVQGLAASSAATSVYFDAVSVTLTPGNWMLNYVLYNTALGATVGGVGGGISINSGTSSVGLAVGDNSVWQAGATAAFDSSISIPGYVVRPTSTTTYYGKALFYFSAGSPSYAARLTAVRIA